MLQVLFAKYLPATLTFIVGVLGVCTQLTINFSSERSKRKLDLNGISRKNLIEFYIPLSRLLHEYKYTQTLLVKNADFSIARWNYPQQETTKELYERFRKLYADIAKLSNAGYIPTRKRLNKEIQAFTNHITLVNVLWINKASLEEFTEMLPTDQLKGYDANKLIKLLTSEINKCR